MRVCLKKYFSNIFDEDVVFGNLLVCLNGKLVGKRRSKERLTFLDVYSGLIKHQASFIKRQLFDKFGLYNEDLRIIADWRIFYKDNWIWVEPHTGIWTVDISYFDNDGISNNSGGIYTYERNAVSAKYIPSMMQPDYEYLLNYGEYSILTKFRITNLLLRILNKNYKSVLIRFLRRK